ncbi:hypothetical protein GQX74_008466 [Glossina fuscipes]|nr:hypothetical protein GQX74_008466 [Glossina fuscipes]
MSTAIVQKNTASATTTNTNNIIYFDCGDIFAAIFFRMMFKDYFYKYNVDMCTRPCTTIECLDFSKFLFNACRSKFEVTMLPTFLSELAQFIFDTPSSGRCSSFDVNRVVSMRLHICSPFDNSERYRHHEHILGLQCHYTFSIPCTLGLYRYEKHIVREEIVYASLRLVNFSSCRNLICYPIHVTPDTSLDDSSVYKGTKEGGKEH